MNTRQELILKYEHYQNTDRTVLTVTLSTFLTNPAIARSDAMRRFWEEQFLHQVRECLPFRIRQKIDYDYVIECSPDGYFHFHGFLALPTDYCCRIWKDGKLNQRLERALSSFEQTGKYRPFCVNAFEIEPVGSVTAWAKYITKTHNYIPSAC